MKLNQLCDATLVALYRAGNEPAFEQLLKRYKSKVYSSIYLLVKDKYIAEDLFQETFIKVIETVKAGRYNEEGKFLPWVMRIAYNLAIDSLRRDKKFPKIALEDWGDIFERLVFASPSDETLKIQHEIHAVLRQLVGELPENQREVLLMRHFAGMSFQDIADLTGVSINTALGRMRYALLNLRKKLAQTDYAYGKDLYPK